MSLNSPLKSEKNVSKNFNHFFGLYKKLLPTESVDFDKAYDVYAQFIGKGTSKINAIFDISPSEQLNYFTVQLLSNFLLVESVNQGSIFNVNDTLIDVVVATYDPELKGKYNEEAEERLIMLTSKFITQFVQNNEMLFKDGTEECFIREISKSTNTIFTEYLYLKEFSKVKIVNEATVAALIDLFTPCLVKCIDNAKSNGKPVMLDIMRSYRLAVFEILKPFPFY